MDIQTVIVAVVIFIAALYVGKMLFVKFSSFSTKSNCGNDCGCDLKVHKGSSVRRG